MSAPAHGSIGFGLYLRCVDVISRFGFHHQNYRASLHDEVGDVFRLFATELVVDLELAFGRFEPFLCIAFKDHRKAAFGIRIELLQGV
ncbi:hypothetical protein D9M68_885640 [compost metagenome]